MYFQFLYLVVTLDAFLDNLNHTFTLDVSVYKKTTLQVELPWKQSKLNIVLGENEDWSWNFSLTPTEEQWASLSKKPMNIQSDETLTVQVTDGPENGPPYYSYLVLPVTKESTEFYLPPYRNSIIYNPLVFIATGSEPTTIRISNQEHLLIKQTIPKYSIWQFSNELFENTSDISFHVASDNPAAVFSGHECLRTNQKDVLCSEGIFQIPPLLTWGTEYVTGPFNILDEFTYYSVHIIFGFPGTFATVDYNQNETHITIVNNELYECHLENSEVDSLVVNCDGTIEPGMFVELRTSNVSSPLLIICSRPCLVLLHKPSSVVDNQTNITPFLSLVPGLGLETPSLHFLFAPTKEDQSYVIFLNMVLLKGFSKNLFLNNRSVEEYDYLDQSIREYTVISVPLSRGEHNISWLENPQSIAAFVYGFIETGNQIDIYGYPVKYIDADDAVGPNPPENALFPTPVEIGLLTFIILIFVITCVLATIASCVARKRKANFRKNDKSALIEKPKK